MACDHVKKRCLTGPVGPDQAGNAALRYRQRHILDGVYAAESFVEIANFKHGDVGPKKNGPGDTQPGPFDEGLTESDRRVLSAVDENLAIASGRFARTDKLNSRRADIIDITAFGDVLKRG